MKYFVIYPDQEPLLLENFNKNNQHLSVPITPIKAPVSNPNLRKQLLEEQIITADNIYDSTNLALTHAHISLWRQAVETQSSITIFESNTVAHKDFLAHQEQSLLSKIDYDLMIWGYDLNWNPCVEIMPCLPKVIYTFPGYGKEEFIKENNSIIDVPIYQNNDLEAVHMLKILSFANLGCYTISAKCAEKLLQQIKEIGQNKVSSYQEIPYGTNLYVFKPIPERDNISLDIEVNRYLEQLNTYMAFPMLAVIPSSSQK
ncbi:glycosyltransferase family 25 protein [Commensalibacter intestini]|uniref:glycosyltransferase family 25 protein n=1 Tax=Commensalibacter intestini TaxID=479936 RepID=UPI0002FF5130|nr:glycosyltransferase family 25 protein [Commensalibacter intestini]